MNHDDDRIYDDVPRLDGNDLERVLRNARRGSAPPADEGQALLPREAWLAQCGIPVRYRNPQADRVPAVCRDAFLAYCRSLRENIITGRGLYILGGVGVGKSHLLALIALAARRVMLPDGPWDVEVIDTPDPATGQVSRTAREVRRPRRATVRYVLGGELDNLLRSERGNPLEQFEGYDLLLFDDLDRLYATAWSRHQLETMVERAYSEQRCWIVAVNGHFVADPALERTASRWQATMIAINAGEGDRRTQRTATASDAPDPEPHAAEPAIAEPEAEAEAEDEAEPEEEADRDLLLPGLSLHQAIGELCGDLSIPHRTALLRFLLHIARDPYQPDDEADLVALLHAFPPCGADVDDPDAWFGAARAQQAQLTC